jgi:hypothetical protein
MTETTVRCELRRNIVPAQAIPRIILHACRACPLGGGDLGLSALLVTHGTAPAYKVPSRWGSPKRMSPQEAKGSQHVSQIALCVIVITCNSERRVAFGVGVSLPANSRPFPQAPLSPVRSGTRHKPAGALCRPIRGFGASASYWRRL